MENFTLYAKASGRCATWRTFPFDSVVKLNQSHDFLNEIFEMIRNF